MKFGTAIEELKENGTEGTLYMQHKSWQKDIKIGVQYSDRYSKMTMPYLYRIVINDGISICVPWLPNQAQLFSNAWDLVL